MSITVTIEERPSTRRQHADELVTMTVHEVVRLTVTRVHLGASSRLERELAEFVNAHVVGFTAYENLQIRISPRMETGLKQAGINQIRQWIEAWTKTPVTVGA